MSMVKILIRAEIKKLKRQRMIWVLYLSVTFSLSVTLVQQLQLNGAAGPWGHIVDMFLYNNTMLFLPFSVALVGGYMIDREYALDTLKNLLVIPVYWHDLIKAKIAVLFCLMLQMGLFEIILCLLAGIILRSEGVTALLIIKNSFQIILSNVCITIGILPIILWFNRNSGKYVFGSILSMIIGVSGVFIINGELVNWHPVTASLPLTTETYGATNSFAVVKSLSAVVLYIMVSFGFYIVLYRKREPLKNNEKKL